MLDKSGYVYRDLITRRISLGEGCRLGQTNKMKNKRILKLTPRILKSV